MLKIYNTLTKSQETLPYTTNDTVNLYSCGPTVYNYQHIGNLRSSLLTDLINRVLQYNGVKVNWVMNITDVDDKTIRDTIKHHGPMSTVTDLKNFTEQYTKIYQDDLQKLGIDTSKITFINVTDKIKETQEFILKLIDKGYGYTADDGSTYFSIEKYQKDFGDYGQLVGNNFLEGKKIGARVAVDEYEKDNLSDFALWKSHSENDAQIYWPHQTLGNGRPGWHIECSVINHEAFHGKTTDIHTGGIDLAFPHHTNEIAQSQPIYKPFVNYWLHGEHLLVDGKKMSKSLGNVYKLNELEEKFPNAAIAFRYLMLQSHYRSQTNFTWESLQAAQSALEKLYSFIEKIDHRESKPSEQYITQFTEAINQDLSTPKAIAIMWELVHDKNIDEPTKYNTLLKFDEVLGLKLATLKIKAHEEIQISEEIQTLVNQRELARASKNFTESDRLRKQIETSGYEILDTPEGPKIQKI